MEKGKDRMDESPLLVAGQGEDSDIPSYSCQHGPECSSLLVENDKPDTMQYERKCSCTEDGQSLCQVVVPRIRAVEKRDSREVCEEKIQGCEDKLLVI